jgi:hypothetical protein
MKRFIPSWRFGMELLLRVVIMLFCVVAGRALSLVANFGLVAFGQVPPPTIIIAQLVSVIVVGPLLLAGYADYCGYRSRASQQ